MKPNHPLWVAWREMLPPVLHQALQRPSTFEQTGLELELVHSAGFRPWDGGARGGGGGRERRWGAGLQKKYFWPFGPQFGLKIRGGHLGHSAGSATGSYLVYVTRYTFGSFSSPITSSLFSCWFISLKKNTHTRSKRSLKRSRLNVGRKTNEITIPEMHVSPEIRSEQRSLR